MPVYYYLKESGDARYLFDYQRCQGCNCLVKPTVKFCCSRCEKGLGHNHTFHFRLRSEPDGDKLKVKGGLEAFLK